MTEILTPSDVVRELARIREEADRGVKLLQAEANSLVYLDAAADRIEYAAYLEAKGTINDRQAISRLQAEEARIAAELQKVKVDYIKQKLRQLSEATMAVQTSARMVELDFKTTR